MAHDGSQYAAEHGRTAENLDGVDADEYIQAEEGGAAGDGQHLRNRRRRPRRLYFQGDVQQSRNEAAGDEGRNDGDENGGNFL